MRAEVDALDPVQPGRRVTTNIRDVHGNRLVIKQAAVESADLDDVAVVVVRIARRLEIGTKGRVERQHADRRIDQELVLIASTDNRIGNWPTRRICCGDHRYSRVVLLDRDSRRIPAAIGCDHGRFGHIGNIDGDRLIVRQAAIEGLDLHHVAVVVV